MRENHGLMRDDEADSDLYKENGQKTVTQSLPNSNTLTFRVSRRVDEFIHPSQGLDWSQLNDNQRREAIDTANNDFIEKVRIAWWYSTCRQNKRDASNNFKMVQPVNVG
jgi:hypothetical protein